MKKLTFLSSVLAGAFLVLGCSHENTAPPTTPNTMTGRAGTTATGVDSTGNPAAGTITGDPAMPSGDPAQRPDRATDPNQPPGDVTPTTPTTTPPPQPAPQPAPDQK